MYQYHTNFKKKVNNFNKMKKFFSIFLIFFTCFTGVFANSENLKNLLDENKKIESELQKI